MKEFSDYPFLIFKSTEAVDEPWDLAVEPKSESKLATFHRIPLKISPTQPLDGVRGGPHTLTARGAA